MTLFFRQIASNDFYVVFYVDSAHLSAVAVYTHLNMSFPLFAHIKTIHYTVGSPLLTFCILNILAQVVFTEANHSVSGFL